MEKRGSWMLLLSLQEKERIEIARWMCWQQVVLTTGEIHQSGAGAARDLKSSSGAGAKEVPTAEVPFGHEGIQISRGGVQEVHTVHGRKRNTEINGENG